MYWANLCVCVRLWSIGRLQSSVKPTLIKSITNTRGRGPRENEKNERGIL